jgi:hypothetical protein
MPSPIPGGHSMRRRVQSLVPCWSCGQHDGREFTGYQREDADGWTYNEFACGCGAFILASDELAQFMVDDDAAIRAAEGE